MNPGSIENWFALPPPRAASYLPAPYGVRRGVTDRFARPSPGAVYLTNSRSTVTAHACAADFGHDNLAWSRKPSVRGRGRLTSAAIGGTLLGVVLMALFGAMTEQRGHVARRSPPAGNGASEVVVATAPEAALAPPPTPRLDSTPALPSAALVTSHAEVLPRPVSGANEHPVPALRQAPRRRSTGERMRAREPWDVRPVSANATLRHAPAKPRPTGAAPPPVTRPLDRCGADWPCGNDLRALQAELKRWEARQQPPAVVEKHAMQTSVRLIDHRRVTEW
ncbi:hypothetical protein [Burkholderia sp.]|uniref:hypothetical protein n=1 Tax=Burkholderia sp. TaxID=36773 RepID=UPI002584293A|nr:hypothetical protein [Burkholderia sp.]MCL4631375.1 hypothetical protein [Burkholderia sp.]